MMSSACDEIISAIISSFIASLAFRHFLPPGRMRGRSCGCRPRKPFAFFCFLSRSSATFCFNSADSSVLASFGSCYAFLKCVWRDVFRGLVDREGKDKIYICKIISLQMTMILFSKAKADKKGKMQKKRRKTENFSRWLCRCRFKRRLNFLHEKMNEMEEKQKCSRDWRLSSNSRYISFSAKAQQSYTRESTPLNLSLLLRARPLSPMVQFWYKPSYHFHW